MPLTHSPTPWLARIRVFGEGKHTRHVAVTTARVAGLAGTATEATAATVGVAEGGLGAVAGNVAELTTLQSG